MTALAWEANDVDTLAREHDGVSASLAGIDSAIIALQARLRDCGAMTDGGAWTRRGGEDRSTAGPDGWDSERTYLADVAEWRRLTAERVALRARLTLLTADLESALTAEPEPAAVPLSIVPEPESDAASAEAPIRRVRVRPARRVRVRRPAVRRTVPPAWSFPVPELAASEPPAAAVRWPWTLGDAYIGPTVAPRAPRVPGAVWRVVGTGLHVIAAAVLWAVAGWVLSLAVPGLPVAAVAVIGTAAGIAAARKSNGRIQAWVSE